ncbi:SDR family oxidoreductase [Kribbella sp. NPDC051770]|uniref:SDR family oxidoreductase n=1 Tax=Kribbella sp. NPDC051770 TaxID=3155413 RepID=UPI003414554F
MTNQTVVITGTASGLGQATVAEFARHGWNVVATVRREQDLGVHDARPAVKTVLLDVTDEAATTTFAERALAQFGRVDVLVNNAGHYQMGPLEDTTMDQARHQFEANVFGLIALTKSFLPVLRAQRSGTVVNIASLTAEQGYPYSSVYAASKAAVATLSEALNLELAEFGVKVRAILPGQHATRIFTKIDIADISAPYQPGVAAFFAQNSPTGSDPAVTAAVVYQAAVDADPAPVRYYSGPDAEFIPVGKQILGPQTYWRLFRQSIIGTAGSLWSSLAAKPGNTPVDMEV